MRSVPASAIGVSAKPLYCCHSQPQTATPVSSNKANIALSARCEDCFFAKT